MNKGTTFCLGLLLGIGGGGFLAHTLLKQEYAQKADEAIAVCREAFVAESVKLRKEAEDQKHNEAKSSAAEAVKTYSPEPEKAEKMIQEADMPKPEPYEISEEIYNDPANPYKAVGLKYFPREGVVMKEDQTILSAEEMDKTIGRKALTLFDDGDTDCVYIRNEALRSDFEIVLSGISYTEWRKKYPTPGK